MSSTSVSWKGKCTSREVRAELIGYIEELAVLNNSFYDDPPKIDKFDDELRGKILVTGSLFSDISHVAGAEGFEILGDDDPGILRFMRIHEPYYTLPQLFSCHALTVHGIQFKLYDWRDEGHGWSRQTVSFVFVDSEDSPDLDGNVVRIENYIECREQSSKVISQADWYIDNTFVNMRYYLEGWFDHFLGWVKYFFIPDLYYARRKELQNYSRVKEDLDDKVKTLGNMNAAKRQAFDEVLERFRSEAEDSRQWLVRERAQSERKWEMRGIKGNKENQNMKSLKCREEKLDMTQQLASISSATDAISCALELIADSRLEEAIEFYDKAIEIDLKNKVAWAGKIYVLGTLGWDDEYKRALEDDPTYIGDLRNKAYDLRERGEHKEAIECYDKILEINPRDVNVLISKGESCEELGQYEEAAKCYESAFGVNPRNDAVWEARRDVWVRKAAYLENLSQYEEAIKCYDTALKMDPKYDRAWKLKGELFRKFGREKDANKCYEMAQKVYNESQQIYLEEFWIDNTGAGNLKEKWLSF